MRLRTGGGMQGRCGGGAGSVPRTDLLQKSIGLGKVELKEVGLGGGRELY